MTAQRKLIVLDVDSTLTQDEGIDLLARYVSDEAAREVSNITALAMAGKLDFAASLTARVQALAGLSLDDVVSATAHVRLSVGAETLVHSAQSAGHLVAAVSGGFHEMIDPLAAALGLDMHRANRLEARDGLLTGKINGPIIDAQAKRTSLREWAAQYDIAPANTVAVGDGGNDVLMLSAAGVGIAYMAKEITRAAADVIIDTPDLSLVLDEIGVPRV